MFGLGRKKEPYNTVVCKARKLENGAVHALALRDLNLPEVVKLADSLEICSRIAFGKIYQKPGTMLEENNPEDQGYNARYDKITKAIGVNLKQGFMRQVLVLSTREPQQLCAELGLTLEVDTPAAPAAGEVA